MQLPQHLPFVPAAQTPVRHRAELLAPHGDEAEPPEEVDRLLHALMAETTMGVAPAGLALAGIDWLMHLAMSPGKWHQLVEKAWKKDMRWLDYAAHATLGVPVRPCIEPLPQGRSNCPAPASAGGPTACSS